MRHPLLGTLILVGALVLTACVKRRIPDADPAREATRHRAALATIVVDNRTVDTLVIAFQPAAVPGPEIILGRAPGRAKVTVAPISADEPVLLRARRANGDQLQLPPRSFAIDSQWIWVILEDDPFTPRADR